MGLTGMQSNPGPTGVNSNPGSTGAVGLTGVVGISGKGGYTGLGRTGLSGVTGMSSPPRCFLCQILYIDTYVNIDFINKTDFSSSEFKKLYGVCQVCHRKTRDLLYTVKDMELIKLPLWINHENIFVREAVKNRLDGKWKCNSA